MGLDMYLTKRAYVKNWSGMGDEEKHVVTVKKGGKLVRDKLPIKELVYEAGYWRKANAIHQWFVNNVQNGEDDCKEYWVDTEKLEELLGLCRRVVEGSKLVKGKVNNGYTYENGKQKSIVEDGLLIEDPSIAAELLPTGLGFFFGNTDYNEWYLDGIKETIKIIEACLEDDSGEFYYSSSW